ncbi:putative protein disulfide-isomerase A6 [Diplonema papillatum]|nr:putative protein disulfide-isomerase A6 [Diplonema papillatum]|eukprot:gene18106-27888_t
MSRAAALVLALCAAQASALYGAKSDVALVDGPGLKKLLSGSEVVLVEFFAPWCGHCKSLVPEMEKVAKALKGVVTVAAVDADAHRDVGGNYQVQGFPTLMLFADDRNTPIPFNGGRTAKELASFAMREAQKVVDARMSGKKAGGGGGGGGGKKSSGGSDVVELTEANFEELVLQSSDLWMVEFFAPWCGHCKNLAPEWAQAATELKGTAKLGAVDATVHSGLAAKYGVQGYPSIKVFGADKLQPTDANVRSSSAIVQHALASLEGMGIEPEVNEATSAAMLKQDCLEKKRICVVAVLPHILDTGAEGRNKYLATLVEAAKAVRTQSFAFMWISAGAQTAFEETFNVAFNYPTYVAINLKKMRFASHKGAFTTEGVTKGLKAIGSFKAATYAIKNEKFLDSFSTTEEWDGKDYKYEEEEEA